MIFAPRVRTAFNKTEVTQQSHWLPDICYYQTGFRVFEILLSKLTRKDVSAEHHKTSFENRNIRDCSLFMPKGGSVIFKQFRHMKNLPLPGSGYFKKLPPLPPPPSPKHATCLRLRNCVQHVFWPVADKSKSIARSFVIVQYGSSK